MAKAKKRAKKARTGKKGNDGAKGQKSKESSEPPPESDGQGGAPQLANLCFRAKRRARALRLEPRAKHLRLQSRERWRNSARRRAYDAACDPDSLIGVAPQAATRAHVQTKRRVAA
ncbi:hypothetical protein ABID59_003387 [Bradyrhizobium sp. S3.3.6]|uniref:hypothetical protein n=1 Tax=Bradyrhizobium sp. S3.3.6 TaxID=3156429 RepID=UPI003393DE98